MPTKWKLPRLRPWHRRKGETAQQFKAFTIYLDTGGSHADVGNELYSRSESAANLFKRPPGNIAKWATRHQWLQRRLAFADHLEQVRQTAVEDQVKKDGVDWAHRRSLLDEKIMSISERMAVRIEEMLAFPLEKQQSERDVKDKDGNVVKHITILEPTKWTMNSPASLLSILKEAAEEVFRRQVGQASEYGDQTGEVERKLLALIDAADEEENGGSGSTD